MAFDFKKEYKEFYMPKNVPEIVKAINIGKTKAGSVRPWKQNNNENSHIDR